ncbi:unnamed protein product [Fraxinus pennsylvanica]|uniref:Apple domain-containing protein n=1 Tax=Fraxinus pennsylvanica TaxID=56036 RepID=A0AAD1YXD8_9LAMI|nr:unnamed protein product [Fraxinus pennsylvanica]
MNGESEIVWSSNVTTSSVNASAQLLNTGNLVLRDLSGRPLWESFGHPSNNFLPTLRIVDNINTGNKVVVSSWKTPTDPEVGNFTAGLQALNIPQIYTWNGNRPHWRSGPWNGQILIGVQDMYSVYLDGFTVVNDSSGTYYFTAPEGKFLMRITLNSTGSLVQTLWNDQTRNWDTTWLAPQQECDVYGTCGPFGSCNALSSPICSCLRGFQPKNSEEWGSGNWSGGCVRSKPLLCDRNNNTSSGGKEDGFLRLLSMKVPDFPEQGPSRPVEECRSLCSMNCSCIAYARDTNLGCMFWSQELIDVQQFSNVGEDLYIRLASSELDEHKDKKLIIIIPIVVGLVAILICIFIYWWLMARRKGAKGKVDAKLYEAGQTYLSASAEIVLKDDMDKVNLEEFPLFTLDVFLFDPSHPSQKILDWKKRFSIIEDFGMARIFGGNQDQANTGRVVGTYGYMAPEYAMEGRISEKSDVYSFGVLMLEIVSGKKNTNFYNHEWSLSLLGCAWKLWNEDNGSAFIDQTIYKAEFQGEMVRCIHIALLCVQEFPNNRPTISTVLAMLSREIVDLPVPEQPVFAEKWNRSHITSSQMGVSINDVTFSVLDGR